MRKLFSFALAALLLGGCAANPADNKPAAVVHETPAAVSTPGPAAEGKKYTLAPDSEVGFVGSKVTGSHTGGFKDVSGTLTVADGDPTKMNLDIAMDVKSVFTDNERLTSHLKSGDFFAADQHPQATFTSTSITPEEGDRYLVTGDLTLRGVTRTITFPAEIKVSDEEIAATAEFSINRMDFGVKYPGKPDDLIREEVVITLDVKATPSA